jgi:hypothetical protein
MIKDGRGSAGAPAYISKCKATEKETLHNEVRAEAIRWGRFFDLSTSCFMAGKKPVACEP